MRDSWRCTWIDPQHGRCLSRATEVDHVIPAARGGGDEITNLTSLCRQHHLSKTGREAATIQKRTPEPHPGIIGEGKP